MFACQTPFSWLLPATLLWLQMPALCVSELDISAPSDEHKPYVMPSNEYGTPQSGLPERQEKTWWTGRSVELFGGIDESQEEKQQEEEDIARRLQATNGVEGDPTPTMIIGALTLMGGTRIQPIILLVNGFIAAEVGEAFTALVEKVTADNIINMFLRALAGFSVGTVGIQNMQFQSVLQGGVLFVSIYKEFRNEVSKWCDGNQWVLLIVDAVLTALGSSLALAFKALFKVLNSAYLSGTMTAFGFCQLLQKQGIWDNPPNEFQWCLAAVFIIFGVWWHSLIVSSNRLDEWQAFYERPNRFKVTPMMQRLAAYAFLPIACLNRLTTGISMALAKSFNLKAAPATMLQILEEVSNKLQLPNLSLLIWKAYFRIYIPRMTGQVLKQNPPQGMDEAQRKKAVQLTGQVCSCLDVGSVRKMLVKMNTTGNYIGVLDACFEDVVYGLKLRAAVLGDKTFSEAECGKLWEKCKKAILDGLIKNKRAATMRAVIYDCGLKKKDHGGLISSYVENLSLQEMMILSKLITAHCFDLDDLAKMSDYKTEMSSQKAQKKEVRRSKRISERLSRQVAQQEAAAMAAAAAEAEAEVSVQVEPEGANVEAAPQGGVVEARPDADPQLRPEGANVEAAPQGGDVEARPNADPQLRAEESHGAPPPAGAAPPDDELKQAALQKSREWSVNKVAESLTGVLCLREPIAKIPVVGPVFRNLEERTTRALYEGINAVPFVGAGFLAGCEFINRKVRGKILSHTMYKMMKKNGVPNNMAADVVQKFAAQDEYFDASLESLLSAATGEGTAPAAGAAAGAAAAGDKKKPFKPQEIGGFTGLVMRQLQDRGPGACRELLLHTITDLFEIDLMLAERFVNTLSVEDLLTLGAGIFDGGFDFNACTRLARNAVEEIEFEIPLSELEDGLDDACMMINWQSPPTIIALDMDWAAGIAGETDCQIPQKGDRLAFVGSKGATYMYKGEFDVELIGAKEEENNKNEADKDPDAEPATFKLKFHRGLDVDFAERFRQTLPSALRKNLGVPFDQGRDLARNLTMDHMRRLVYILLNGGLKKLDDLSDELGVEVNFEQAFKSHIPIQCVLKFGFKLTGALKFTQALDPATTTFSTRLLQMLGGGDLEAMSSILCKDDVTALDALHQKRFPPRVDLDRLLGEAKAKDDSAEGSAARCCRVLRRAVALPCRLCACPSSPLELLGCCVCGPWWPWTLCCRSSRAGPSAGPSAAAPRELEAAAEAEAAEVKSLDIEFTEKGKFQLLKNGEALGFIQPATVEITLMIWNSLMHNHDSQEVDRESETEDLTPWSAEAAIEKMDEVRKDMLEVMAAKKAFKWPEMIVADAMEKGLSEADADVAKKIFMHACEEARESVWTKWQRKLMTEASVALGPPKQKRGTGVATEDVEDADIREALENHARLNTAARDWMQEFFDALPPPGKLRGQELKKMEKAIHERDTFRMQKRANKWGIVSVVPLEGVISHLKQDLQALPVDITGQVNELSDYLTAMKHPLTGKLAMTGMAARPADASAPPTVPKVKELFKLAQTGGFEILSGFAAASAPGGPRAVASQMRETIAARLQICFPDVSKDQARGAAESLIPATHKVVAKLKFATSAPLAGESLASPDARDGSELKKGLRVAVCEEKGDLVRLSKPQKGWLKSDEVELLEPDPAADARGTADASVVLRSVKNYCLDVLDTFSDENDWGLDFVKLARTRIVDTIMDKFPDLQKILVERGAKKLDLNGLKSSLQALDRKDLDFVLEACALPKMKPKAKPKGWFGQAKELQKTEREVYLEKMTTKLEKELEEHKTKLAEVEAARAAAEAEAAEAAARLVVEVPEPRRGGFGCM